MDINGPIGIILDFTNSQLTSKNAAKLSKTNFYKKTKDNGVRMQGDFTTKFPSDLHRANLAPVLCY